MLIFSSGVYLLLQALSAVVFSLIGLVILPLSSCRRAYIISFWARFNLWTLKKICRLSYFVHWRGKLPSYPSIIVSNHQSAFETLAFQLIFPPQSYILKKSLLRIPFFGWGLAANRPIAIDRNQKHNAMHTLVKEGSVRISEGRWLVVFPEGTRMPYGCLGDFQGGAALLAKKLDVPIIPVAHNAGLYWPKRGFIKRKGEISVVVGEAIYPKGKTTKEINNNLFEWIEKTCEEMK